MGWPFLVEDSYRRVNQCLETLGLIDTTRAVRDFLSGLYNRRHFLEAGNELFQAWKHAENIACVMLDIDHFKKVNDNYGYDVGDSVITSIAGLLREHAHERDIVARIGGEAFHVLSPGGKSRDVLQRFESLRRRIETPPATLVAGRGPLYVTTSIGICGEVCESLGAMMKRADEQLYKAKHAGRNRVEFWPQVP